MRCSGTGRAGGPAGLQGAFCGGCYGRGEDGFTLDVPDLRLTGPRSGPGGRPRGSPRDFPRPGSVTLTETGTHSSIYASGAVQRRGTGTGDRRWRSSRPGCLVIRDRAFPGGAVVKAYTQAGAHLLIRHGRAWPSARKVLQVTGRTWAAMNLAGNQKGAHPGWGRGAGDRVQSVWGGGTGGELSPSLLRIDCMDARCASAAFSTPRPPSTLIVGRSPNPSCSGSSRFSSLRRAALESWRCTTPSWCRQ